MKLVALLIFLAIQAQAETWQERLADECIFWAEGGHATRFPYGVHDPSKTKPAPLPIAAARARCLTIINQEYFRWQDSGCSGDFIDRLSRRYAASHDIWAKNVRWYMQHPKKIDR